MILFFRLWTNLIPVAAERIPLNCQQSESETKSTNDEAHSRDDSEYIGVLGITSSSDENSDDDIKTVPSSSEENAEQQEKDELELELEDQLSDSSNSVVNTKVDQPAWRSSLSCKHAQMLEYTEFGKEEHSTSNSSTTTKDDPTVQKAMKTTAPEVKKWRETINLELQTLTKKKTWKCVNKSTVFWKAKSKRKRFFIHTHVILRIKRNAERNVQNFKARVVFGAYTQRPSIDFNNFHAPVVDFSVVLLVLNITLQHN